MGEKTDNIPPRFQAMVVEGIRLCEAARAKRGRSDLEIRKAVHDGLVELLNSHDDKMGPVYMAKGLNKIVRYAMEYSRRNSPTHRKGFGEAGTEEILAPPAVIFNYSGEARSQLPDGDGDGLPDPDPYEEDEDDSWLEYQVPMSEIDRARDMLDEVDRDIKLSASTALAFVRETAKRLGGRWGLNGKRGNPNDPSKDILAYDFPGFQPQLYDVISGWDGPSPHVTWHALNYPQRSGAVWLEP